MQRWQKQIDQLFERFQDRWDTDQSYRTTVSIGAVALTLVLLCVVVSLAIRVSTTLLAGANVPTPTTTPDSSEQSGPPGQAIYTLPPLTPAVNTEGSNAYTAIPVPTTTTDVPTATTAPGVTPTPTANPDATPSVTTTATAVTLKATELTGSLKPGQATTISVTTNPAQANVNLTLTIQYATGCAQTPPVTTTLDPGGQANLNFTVASCMPTSITSVTGTFTLAGQSPITQSLIANH